MPFFEKIDKDRNGHLDIFELSALLNHFTDAYEARHETKLTEEQKKEIVDKLIGEMDRDGSGTIDQLELKVFLTRKYDEMFRKSQKA